ncbi:hypothetical protein BH20ACI1_BH20ACI1_25790 [soil metagenome]
MLTKKYRENPFILSIIFAVFGLVIFAFGAINMADAQINKSTYLDFTGNGRTDWAVISTLPKAPGQPFRWKILGNPASPVPNEAFIRIFDYGSIGDIILAGDYIGDRKTDLTVYRSGSQSIFYVAQFPIGTGGIMLDRAVPWGARDGSFAQGDYDGDGKLDFTVTRRNDDNSITWYILGSSSNVMRAVNFGFRGGRTTLGADFTGDGKDELVFTADVNGGLVYYIGDALTGELVLIRQWGFSSEFSFVDRNLPPADYTGDGKADFVAVRQNVNPMVWYILDPATNTATATRFGFGLVNAGDRRDQPIRGDYDGDGRQDIAVYRTSNYTFYVLRSSDGGITAQTWGETGDSALNIPYFVFIVD